MTGPTGSGAVPGLALEPLQGPVLPVAHGDIVGHGVPGNCLAGLVFVRAEQFGTDDDGELGFPVDAAAAVDFHGVVGADQGVRVLGEQRGVLGKLAAHFLDVVTVVQAAADDFAGAGKERCEVCVGCRDDCLLLGRALLPSRPRARHSGWARSAPTSVAGSAR